MSESEYDSLDEIEGSSSYNSSYDKTYPFPNNKLIYEQAYSDPNTKIGATAAWSRGWTGQGTTISIIDSGIDEDHSEFVGKISASACFVSSCSSTETSNDITGHGTHVAGLAAAALDGSGMAGSAPDAKLLNAKVFRSDGYTEGGAIPNAIDWSMINGADVINMSLGASADDQYEAALVETSDGFLRLDDDAMESLGWGENGYDNYLYYSDDELYEDSLSANDKTIMVISAGNEGYRSVSFPAQFAALENPDGTNRFDDRIIIAGAWDELTQDTAWFSNTARSICFDYNEVTDTCNTQDRISDHYLLAPGQRINSASIDGGYILNNGTSMAAPVISGGAALMRQMWPHLKGGEIANILFDTADKSFSGYQKEKHGQGIMDLDNATSPQGTLSAAITSNIRDAENKNEKQTIRMFNSAGVDLSSLESFVAIDKYDRNFDISFDKITTAIESKKGQLDLDRNKNYSSYLDFSNSSKFKIGDYEASISSNINKFSINKTLDNKFYIGALYEGDSFLGNSSNSSIANIDNSATLYIGKGFSLKPSKELTLSGDISFGATNVNLNNGSMLQDIDPLLSSSAKLEASYIPNKYNEINFGWYAPVAIKSGKAKFKIPTNVDNEGNISYSSKEIDLGYESNESSFGLSYKYKGNIDDINYYLGFSSNKVLNKYNISNNNDTEAKIDFSVKF